MGLIINWSPDGWGLIIILIIVLILFGANRLPAIARGMAESIENFKRAWISREQRRQSDDSHPWWFIALAVLALVVALFVLGLDVFSDEQKLVLAIVLLAWIGVGYWSFGRLRR
jgi:TatA/E family protein of Tat protein translocase